MTYNEFKRQAGKAGLSVREFAETIKLTPNSVTNYAMRNEVPTHLAIIVTLMGEMAEHGLDFKKALGRIGIEPNKPRGARQFGRSSEPAST